MGMPNDDFWEGFFACLLILLIIAASSRCSPEDSITYDYPANHQRCVATKAAILADRIIEKCYAVDEQGVTLDEQ